MPAPSPKITDDLAATLVALGERLRTHRKAMKVSAVAAAEAAGMSRVTLHRIERGEPSVAMGAYLSAIAAMGMEIELVDPHARRGSTGQPAKAARLPTTIRLADFAQLKRLAWQLHGAAEITPKEALDLYERNWRHVDRQAMDEDERELVTMLVNELGQGRLLV